MLVSQSSIPAQRCHKLCSNSFAHGRLITNDALNAAFSCVLISHILVSVTVLAFGPCVPIVPPVISPAAVAAAPLSSDPVSQSLPGPSSRRRPVSDVEAAQFCAPKRHSSFEACSSTQWSAPLLEQPPMVGKKRLHASHRLEHCRGIIFCTRCVFFSVTRARELSRQCSGKPNINTKNTSIVWQEERRPRRLSNGQELLTTCLLI